MKRTVSLPIDPTQLREPAWLQVGDLVNVHGRPMMAQGFPARGIVLIHGIGIVVKLSRTGENSFAAQVFKPQHGYRKKLHWFDVSELSIVDSAQDSESG